MRHEHSTTFPLMETPRNIPSQQLTTLKLQLTMPNHPLSTTNNICWNTLQRIPESYILPNFQFGSGLSFESIDG